MPCTSGDLFKTMTSLVINYKADKALQGEIIFLASSIIMHDKFKPADFLESISPAIDLLALQLRDFDFFDQSNYISENCLSDEAENYLFNIIVPLVQFTETCLPR